MCSLVYVPAGQRGARMVRTTPGSDWIGKNCYQNCYRCGGVALEASSLAAVRPWARQLLR